MPLKNRKREPGAAKPASRLFQTGAAGQIPLQGTRNGPNACKDDGASVGASSEFEDGRSPPGKLLHSEEKQGAAREPLNPDPVPVTPSLVLGGDSPVPSLTIPPTKEGTL